MFLMKNRVRTYAWGSRTAIPTLLGEPTPAPDPHAELWIGAHPGDSSNLCLDTGEQPLVDAINNKPVETLGPDVVRHFDGTLPFLLKLLAADSPLSLQAHPNMAQARAGFDAEQAAGIPVHAPTRNYKDRSHKPEMIYALTPFEALCGFRPTTKTVRLLDDLAVAELDDIRQTLNSAPGAVGLHRIVTTLLASERAVIAPIVETVAATCRQHLGRPSPFGNEFAMAARLAEHYPGDPGVLIALLMNRVDLAPGEAVYLPAGILHAYLHGLGVEIMASSDNVLRGGLTTKHVDIQELSAVVTFQPAPPTLIAPVPIGPREWVCPTPSPEFELSVITPESTGQSLAHTGPQILLSIEGMLVLTDAHRHQLTLQRGQSAFIPADHGAISITGNGTVIRARDGLAPVTFQPSGTARYDANGREITRERPTL